MIFKKLASLKDDQIIPHDSLLCEELILDPYSPDHIIFAISKYKSIAELHVAQSSQYLFHCTTWEVPQSAPKILMPSANLCYLLVADVSVPFKAINESPFSSSRRGFSLLSKFSLLTKPVFVDEVSMISWLNAYLKTSHLE